MSSLISSMWWLSCKMPPTPVSCVYRLDFWRLMDHRTLVSSSWIHPQMSSWLSRLIRRRSPVIAGESPEHVLTRFSLPPWFEQLSTTVALGHGVPALEPAKYVLTMNQNMPLLWVVNAKYFALQRNGDWHTIYITIFEANIYAICKYTEIIY